MARKVLVTGGAGFIGSNLAQNLLQGGEYVVYAMDNLHPQVHHENGRPELLPEDVQLLVGDVTSEGNWDTVLKLIQPDIIVHLAAETGTGQSLKEASRHGSVNVVGTTTMLDALTRHNIVPEHIILSSSRAVYGEGMWQSEAGVGFYPNGRDHAMLERAEWDYTDASGSKAHALPYRADITEARPTNIYAATKLAQENILKAWTMAMGSDLSILRFQNVYGPGQSLQNSYTGVVAFFARQAAQKKEIPVYEDGAIMRDFVFIDDVVQSIVKSIQTPPKPNENRVLDVGSGDARTILETAKVVAELCGAPEPKVTGQYRDGDVRAASCDLSMTRQAIGYSPEWPLEKGLAKLLEWVKTQEL